MSGLGFDPASITTRSRYFASNLTFANDWDDHAVVETALEVRDTDTVFTLAGAGCNMFALLLRRPKAIVAIDVSPPQIALVALKLEAVRHLEYADYLALVGSGRGSGPAYDKLCDLLPVPLRKFWDEHLLDINHGLCEAGTYERKHHRLQGQLRNAVGKEALQKLFEIDRIPEQVEYFDRVVGTETFAKEMQRGYSYEQVIASGRIPPMVKRYSAEPSRFTALYPAMVRRVLTHTLGKHNFYLRHYLTGSLGPVEHGPLHMRPDQFAELKTLIDRVTLVTADVRDYFRKARPATFDKVSLSSVLCAYSDDERDQLLDDVARTLRPGGRWTGAEHELSAAHRAERCGLVARDNLAAAAAKINRFSVFGRRVVEERS